MKCYCVGWCGFTCQNVLDQGVNVCVLKTSVAWTTRRWWSVHRNKWTVNWWSTVRRRLRTSMTSLANYLYCSTNCGLWACLQRNSSTRPVPSLTTLYSWKCFTRDKRNMQWSSFGCVTDTCEILLICLWPSLVSCLLVSIHAGRGSLPPRNALIVLEFSSKELRKIILVLESPGNCVMCAWQLEWVYSFIMVHYRLFNAIEIRKY